MGRTVRLMPHKDSEVTTFGLVELPNGNEPEAVRVGDRFYITGYLARQEQAQPAEGPDYYEASCLSIPPTMVKSVLLPEKAQVYEPEQADWMMCLPPNGINFETALLNQFSTHPEEKEKHQGIYEILQQPDSPRKRRQLIRMERAARGSLGLGTQAAIDWSTIDWTKVFSVILQVLGALLPFLIALI